MAKFVRWTVSDLELFPDDGKRREIIDGEMFVSPQPQFFHQVTRTNIGSELHDWNRESHLSIVASGPGVNFSPEDAVAPALMWTSRQRVASGLDAAGHLTIAPDLVVEVLSPGVSNERRDLELVLVATPLDSYAIQSPILPGFRCPVSRFFADLPDPRSVC